jgi:hypothetical protein
VKVKQIEKRDSVLTPKQQIDRLLRPGSTYLNLNPFEVLQVDPDISLDDIKTKYRRLSILVHPDKNIDDKDRAQTAFEGELCGYSLIHILEDVILEQPKDSWNVLLFVFSCEQGMEDAGERRNS